MDWQSIMGLTLLVIIVALLIEDIITGLKKDKKR
jgi:hypothetical protein